MTVDPTALSPKPGAGNPAAGVATPPLLRPAGANLIGGTLPPAIGTFVVGGAGDYPHHAAMRAAHARMQSGLAANGGGHVAVIGDSNIEACPVFAISPFAVNYGIAGDGLGGLVARLREIANPATGRANYYALSSAAAIVLQGIPFNDICVASPNLAAIEASYVTLLSYFTGPLVIVPPVPNTSTSAWNANINTFNSWLSTNFGARSATRIVAVSDITGGVNLDDHWNGSTQNLIMARARAALTTLLG